MPAEIDANPRILFLCTGNSCRSQMAEGFAHALLSDIAHASSAGTKPQALNPLAVRAMSEAGIDISRYTSKAVAQVPAPDLVITVCDAAHESCPVIPGARVLHAPFEDPPRLASSARTDEEALPHYRKVRDQIRDFVITLRTALVHSSQKPVPDGIEDSGRALCSQLSHSSTKGTLMQSTNTSTAPKSCCGPDCCSDQSAVATESSTLSADALRDHVRAGYSKIATAGGWSAAQGAAMLTEASAAAPAKSSCAPAGGCCGPATFSPEQLATAIGYSASDLSASPAEANMGLSCGNPTAIASLKPGEVVLDLGSGGGFDCFVAGPKVGASGRVIGVDMTPDMLSKARTNTASYRAQSKLDNVEFRLGEIENLPVADNSVDVVISNCVLNLSPDKPRVWREIARVLKPGGRVAVSDLALLRPLPDSVKSDIEALVGCIAGAVLVEDTRRQAAAAGLTNIVLTPKTHYIDAMTDWQDPLYKAIIAKLPAGSKPSDYITSLDVSALQAR